jgi:N4-gp56 family major capsid protein
VTVDSSGDISHTKTDATGFTLSWLDKLERYITTMDVPPNPIMIGGEPKYVLVLSPYAVEQMKADTTAKSWIEIQKHAGVRGEGNYIYKGALGSYGMFVLHSYSKIPTTTVSSSVYCHNLLFGAQAAVVGFGDAGGKFSFSWNEEVDDYGNLVGIAGASILGIKKCRFDLDNTDFGVLTVWTKN